VSNTYANLVAEYVRARALRVFEAHGAQIMPGQLAVEIWAWDNAELRYRLIGEPFGCSRRGQQAVDEAYVLHASVGNLRVVERWNIPLVVGEFYESSRTVDEVTPDVPTRGLIMPLGSLRTTQPQPAVPWVASRQDPTASAPHPALRTHAQHAEYITVSFLDEEGRAAGHLQDKTVKELGAVPGWDLLHGAYNRVRRLSLPSGGEHGRHRVHFSSTRSELTCGSDCDSRRYRWPQGLLPAHCRMGTLAQPDDGFARVPSRSCIIMTVQRPTRQTLEEYPARALTFLSTMGRNQAIFTILAQRGYTIEIHDEGWRLLHAASGYRVARPSVPGVEVASRQAMAELDQWDNLWFPVASSALLRLPLSLTYLMEGLAPVTGPASILVVTRLLDRLDAMERGEDRTVEAQASDAEALRVLATRGLDSTERQRVRRLLQVAAQLPEPSGTPESVALAEAADATRAEALYDLYVWYQDWATVARTFIKRRDYLLWLGLARRKKTRRDAVPTE